MTNYQLALAERISKDRGATTLRVGATRLPPDVRVAYPRAIS
jgi:hypothetical protein